MLFGYGGARILRMIELASRENGSLHVVLLWKEQTELCTVSVDDSSTGDRFELVVDQSARPLDIYYHPYAYAALRGVEYGVAA
jgi:hypothetical protein